MKLAAHSGCKDRGAFLRDAPARMRPRRAALSLGPFLMLVIPFAVCLRASAQEAPAWPDSYVGRLQALALLQTLNAELLASRSATLTLEAWCREHRLANVATIVAVAEKGAATSVTAEQQQRLEVTPRG